MIDNLTNSLGCNVIWLLHGLQTSSRAAMLKGSVCDVATLFQYESRHSCCLSAVHCLNRLASQLMSDRQTMDRQKNDSRKTADRQWTAVCLLSLCCLSIVCLSDMSWLTSQSRLTLGLFTSHAHEQVGTGCKNHLRRVPTSVRATYACISP